MPRLPKDPELRARRNKASTAADLDTSVVVKAATLRLSDFPDGTERIHARTRKWWRVVWASPMAARWLEADVERLYLVAIARNHIYISGATTAFLAEIRQHERELGLTPMDRRRLEWRIAGPVQAAEQAVSAARTDNFGTGTNEAPAAAADGDDPRKFLRMVQ